jgi:transposase-like protein
MNIIERGRAFLQTLRDLAGRSGWDWRRCPHCGDTLTCKWGSYTRQPWFLEGRRVVQVPRHRCEPCGRTYSERSALLIRGGWYAREVRRCAIDHWQHLGTSTRRAAEVVRSWLGRQERWRRWRPLDPRVADQDVCHLSASTVERWLDQAGQAAQESVPGQLAGAETAGQLATDGLWARLAGGAQRVVLGLTDPLTGLVWPPVVAVGEAAAAHWASLFERAAQAGLVLAELRGLASDGAKGLESYLRQALPWVSHQRCVFHLWRGLAGELAQATLRAAAGVEGKAAQAARRAARRTLVGLIRAVFDAGDEVTAQGALVALAAHELGAALALAVAAHLDAALVHLCGYNQGLGRASPEWLWRDFRLRLGHGRNHGAEQRLERAALLWAIYQNFEPAQERSERKRKYRHPGQSPLALAGLAPGEVSYLDALGV